MTVCSGRGRISVLGMEGERGEVNTVIVTKIVKFIQAGTLCI